MKNTINFVLLLCLFNLNAQNSFEGEVIYTVGNNVDLSDEVSKYKDSSLIQKKIISKILNDTDDINNPEFKLLFTRKKASYQYIQKLGVENHSKLNIVAIAAKASGDFFFDFDRKVVISSFGFKGENFKVIDSLNSYDWKITKEKRIIGGYTCFKATGIQKAYFSSTDETYKFPVEAWFTPQIAISGGPDGKGGLPGLILYLKLKSKSYVAKKITPISAGNRKEIKLPKKNVILRSDYNKMKRKLYLSKI